MIKQFIAALHKKEHKMNIVKYFARQLKTNYQMKLVQGKVFKFNRFTLNYFKYKNKMKIWLTLRKTERYFFFKH